MISNKLSKEKQLTYDKLITLNKPEQIYVPVMLNNNTDITIIPKIGDYVYKGSVLGHTKGDLKQYIYSTISGKVVDIVNKPYIEGPKGILTKCIVIENDFKETTENLKGIKENINDYTKEEFIELIRTSGIVGHKSKQPVFQKYNTDNKIKTLVVNACECEEFLTNDFACLYNHLSEILEVIDAILEINKIDEAIITLTNNNLALASLIEQSIGTYLKIHIRLVPNKYPIGYERMLVKKLFNIQYNETPLEHGIIVQNVQTIYAIYNVLKTQMPVMNRIITVSGYMLNKKTNVEVKIGTPISYIMNNIGYINGNKLLVIGGPLTGEAIDTDDTMITQSTSGVLVMFQNHELESECIKCGKCSINCPMKLLPTEIIKNIKSRASLEKLNTTKCIECGLCSYICPARINLREKIRTAKMKLEEDKKDEV